MKRRRHTPEQIVRKLREAGFLVGEARTNAGTGLAAAGVEPGRPVATPNAVAGKGFVP